MQTSPRIILVGLGKVGQEVLRQLKGIELDYQIIGVADSSACLVGDPLSNEQVDNAIKTKIEGRHLTDLPDSSNPLQLSDSFSPDTIIVDTSAAQYLNWEPALSRGCKLVFANKNALSTSWVQDANLYNHSGVRYESTVGAGLPVIATLRGLVQSGDKILRIEGVMSGTLGYICNQLDQGLSYSQAVRQAFDAGYTEPDPRDDLSGFDVLRKAIILARTAGWQLEQEDFQVEPLYDEKLLGNSVEDFLLKTSLLDQTYTHKVETAANEEKVLRYLATISPKGGSVGLQAVERKSQLGALRGAGNYFAIYSQHYNEIPLVIAGPGAGIAVTANGVLNDIIALLNR
jgi:homoserine dehydrogenase